jgi:hypothetical protein
VAGPTGPPGPAGAAGGTAVSADANNFAHLGSDSLVYVPQALPLTGGALTGPVTNSASFTLSGSLQTFGFTTGGGGQFGMFAYNDTSLALGPTDGGGTANNVWAEFRTNGDFHPWGTILLGTVNSDPSSIVGGIEMYPGFGGFGVTAMFLDGAGLTMQLPLTLVGDPTAALQSASKQYVDSAIATVNAKIGSSQWDMSMVAERPAGVVDPLDELRALVAELTARVAALEARP